MHINIILGILFLVAADDPSPRAIQSLGEPMVRVSPRDARYFELTSGEPYIPIGLNLAALWQMDDQAGFDIMERYLHLLHTNGGNHARVWLSSAFWDIEHERCGQYDDARGRRIDQLLELARKHDIRLKLTIEHFREIDPDSGFSQTWAFKPLHHVSRGGTAHNMSDWLSGEASRRQFEKKLDWYAARYGDQPYVFGWELWNEVNAVRSGDYLDWTEHMLVELRRRFPRNLVMQSLGSFDRPENRSQYEAMCRLPNNDVAQAHRYLDLGARLEVCHGPVDVLAADAVRELLAMKTGRPVLLAESGAVEPNHTGPFKLYAKDKAGMLLHDVLFAPFFAGAAGPGQCWHWNDYVDRNDLWWHFRRFANAVDGIDPAAERFNPEMVAHPRLRVYLLRGERTTLLWCRDAENTWRGELADDIAPQTLTGLSVELPECKDGANIRTYDPWSDRWHALEPSGGTIVLPAFQRSIVVRITH